MRAIVGTVLAMAMLAGCSGGGASIATPPAVGPTDEPTAVEPTDSATPAEPETGAFEPISLKGKGKKVAKFTIPEGAAAIADFTHKGRANFIVHSIDANGDTIDGLVNTIGNYKGTVLFDVGGDEHSVAFAIDADGTWTATIKPITAAKVWDPKTTLAGTGDNVYQIAPPSSGLVTLTLTYSGNENFIVHSYTLDGIEGLANEIGKFKGEVVLPDGSILFEVDADTGKWTATPG
jgi:hypothetical protein